MTWLADDLLRLALAQSEKALASGALVPLAMDLRVVHDGGVPFEVRFAGALAKKDLSRALASGSKSAAPYDPFEPYDPALFVADVSRTHVALLNKFPTIPGHIVLVTRHFAPQLGVPSREDFAALALLARAMNGLLFYNGGPVAGASQEHRHFQLVPGTGRWPIEALLASAPARGEVPGLPFRHAFLRHDLASASSPEHATEVLERAFRDACADLALDLSGPLLPPLNFLATREWMMVVPRTREHWNEISVNALGFAGLLLVRAEDRIATLERFGPLRMLDTVTRP